MIFSNNLQNLRELTERLFVLVDVVHQILLDDVCVKNLLGTLLVPYYVAECFGRRLYYCAGDPFCNLHCYSNLPCVFPAGVS